MAKTVDQKLLTQLSRTPISISQDPVGGAISKLSPAPPPMEGKISRAECAHYGSKTRSAEEVQGSLEPVQVLARHRPGRDSS